MKHARILSALLCAAMLLSLLGACTGAPSSTTTSAGSAAGTTTAKAAATTTAKATTTAATTTAPQKEEIVTLSAVSTDAGIKIPEGTDPNDNPFVNVAKNYANCLVEYEIIPWADYQTKMNLLLASGKYPDILHTAYNQNIVDVESRGAFVNLLPYYENSEIVQKRVDYDMYIETMKNAKTGEYYAIPMGTTGDGYPDGIWMRARYDLLEKVNNGKWPETIDEWVETARLVKQDNPNANPFSAWCPGTMIFQYNKQFWYAYGTEANLELKLQKDNTYLFNVELPNYKQAMELHKMLYDEGLLSQTFATNTDYALMQNDADNNDLLVWSDSVQQMGVPTSQLSGVTAVDNGQRWICAPLLKEYPVPQEEAMWYNMKFSAFDSGHRVHISKSCKYPDRAWRFIEGLCSDELFDLMFWGEEGVTYKVVNNERVIDASTVDAFKDENRSWGFVYGFITGYGQGRGANIALAKMTADEEWLPLIDMHLVNAANVGAPSIRRPVIVLGDLLSDDVSAKWDEAQGVITSLAVQYIMGRISMAEYDAGIANFLATYGFMKDEYTAAYKTRYVDKVG